MTLAFQSMLMIALVVCGAVAWIPLRLLNSEPELSPALRTGLRQPGLWIVEGLNEQWYLNGALHSKGDLVSLLRHRGQSQMIHYLPSDALPLQKVASSMRWLRSLAPNAVVLDRPMQPFRFSP